MSGQGRFAFEPVLNLVTGRPVGMEVIRCQARDRTEHMARNSVWGARQLAEFDSGIAIAGVLHGTDYDATVPLHVDLHADTVVAARPRVRHLRASVRHGDGHRAAPPIVVEVNPALSAAPAGALVTGLRELRADGFGIALDGVGRGFGLDLVAALEPDLVKIEPGVVARLPVEPAARAVVRAIGDVCAATGVRPAAVGVSTPDELAAVRDHGIPWAQGPLLAAPRRRPSTSGILVPASLLPPATGPETARHDTRRPVREPRLADLAQAAVSLPADATAEEVRQAMADHPQAAGVVLLDAARRPTGFLDRNRFMIAISGPFGHALHAGRPAAALAEPPRAMPAVLDVRTAVARCLSGDRARQYDDLVLLDPDGACAGTVRVMDLLRDATGPPFA